MNIDPPSVIVFGSSDVPVVGSAVSSSAGTWTGSGFPTFSYQWKKCLPRFGSCYLILTTAATSSVFVPTGDLIGWSLRVEVTATNSAGSSKAQSEPTLPVIGNPPVNNTPAAHLGVRRPADGRTGPDRRRGSLVRSLPDLLPLRMAAL